ncbi:L-ascorbate oxidase-like protein, partial [Cucurbita argyrosperma subsp. sororia]
MGCPRRRPLPLLHLEGHLRHHLSAWRPPTRHPDQRRVPASTRFLKNILSTKAIIRYTNGKGPASSDLPEAPIGWAWSLNQFRTFRWNLTASAARPNPQGSFRYGSINITRTIKLVNSAGKVDGKLRYAINGVSHVDPETPLKLAEYFKVPEKVFKYDMITDEGLPEGSTTITVAPNVLNATYRNFVEIIFENHEKVLQAWHLNGYSFFAVAIEPGKWSPEKRANYNLLDAVSRHTIQVYPKSWAAILLTFDNCGMWNLRSELTENRYLGQQLYVSVLSPALSLRDEYNIPDRTLLCGVVKGMPLPKPYTI